MKSFPALRKLCDRLQEATLGHDPVAKKLRATLVDMDRDLGSMQEEARRQKKLHGANQGAGPSDIGYSAEDSKILSKEWEKVGDALNKANMAVEAARHAMYNIG